MHYILAKLSKLGLLSYLSNPFSFSHSDISSAVFGSLPPSYNLHLKTVPLLPVNVFSSFLSSYSSLVFLPYPTLPPGVNSQSRSFFILLLIFFLLKQGLHQIGLFFSLTSLLFFESLPFFPLIYYTDLPESFFLLL